MFYRPGVTDNVADSTQATLAEMGIRTDSVRTGTRYELSPPPAEDRITRICKILGNECIERISVERSVVEDVTALPEPYRRASLLRYFEELAPTTIAAQTGSRSRP